MNAPKLRLLAKQLLLIRQGRRDLDFPPPEAEELAALLDDRVDFNRKQQIYAYLNTSPELMQQWVDLIEARHDLSEAEQRRSEIKKTDASISQLFFEWLSGLHSLTLTSSVAVLVVAVTLVYMQWPGPQRQEPFNTIKAADKMVLDQSLLDFLAGTAAACSVTLEEATARDELYAQLLEVRDTYARSSFSAPELLFDLNPENFGDVNSACQFIGELTQELKDK